MGGYAELVKKRGLGIPFPDADIYYNLLECIRKDESIPTIGRRAVLWILQTSRLSTPVMAAFSHREWGPELGHEIQVAADDVSSKYDMLFLRCGTGLHLTHHCGGFDDHGRWLSSFPGNTLWVAEGDENYPQPGGARDNKDMLVITPRLHEIGSVSLKNE